MFPYICGFHFCNPASIIPYAIKSVLFILRETVASLCENILMRFVVKIPSLSSLTNKCFLPGIFTSLFIYCWIKFASVLFQNFFSMLNKTCIPVVFPSYNAFWVLVAWLCREVLFSGRFCIKLVFILF